MTDDYKTLKLTKPYMHGPAVVRLQEMLNLYFEATGETEDLLDCDGIFGCDTKSDVVIFQTYQGITVDGICGPATWNKLMYVINNREYCDPKDSVIVDRRGLHVKPRLYKCKRPWSNISGVTLHQTGCEMPSNPAGWDRVNAHIGITQEGLCILINDPTYFIWHAQGLSDETIGLEIEGNFEGIDGDMSTLWKGGGGPHHLNPKMMAAIEQARLWISEQFKANGKEWKHIYAHRQSARSRIGDPGEEIWRQVGIPWRNLIVTVDHYDKFTHFGTGRPIPYMWGYQTEFEYNCAPGRK